MCNIPLPTKRLFPIESTSKKGTELNIEELSPRLNRLPGSHKPQEEKYCDWILVISIRKGMCVSCFEIYIKKDIHVLQNRLFVTLALFIVPSLQIKNNVKAKKLFGVLPLKAENGVVLGVGF